LELAMESYDLDSAVAHSHTDIATITACLHEQGERAGSIQPNNANRGEDATANDNGDDRYLLSPGRRCRTENGDVGISDPRPVPAELTFFLDRLPKGVIDGFTALTETDE
jgi:hypothetical protein